MYNFLSLQPQPLGNATAVISQPYKRGLFGIAESVFLHCPSDLQYYRSGDHDLYLDHYVTVKALDWFFKLLAEEEKKIRTDPVARTA
ncbi:MAG: DUF4197 family protein, partial [Deltaproteobacteria bacterium]